MNRLLLLRNASHCAANLLRSPATLKSNHIPSLIAPPAELTRQPLFRLFSSESGNDPTEEEAQINALSPAPETDLSPSVKKEASIEVPDVSNKGNMSRSRCSQSIGREFKEMTLVNLKLFSDLRF